MKNTETLPRTKQITAILNKIDRTERRCTAYACAGLFISVLFVMHYNSIFEFIFG